MNKEQVYKIVEKILEDLDLQGVGYELTLNESNISGYIGGPESLSIGFDIELTDDIVKDIFDGLYSALDRYPTADAAFEEYHESVDYMPASEFLAACTTDVEHFNEKKQKLNSKYITNMISSVEKD